MEKYKVRFVVRGFSKKKGVNYEDTFSLVTKYTSIRELRFLFSIKGWRIHQMDVKKAFLIWIIEEKVYI